jgi:hypothetical protein
MICSSDFSDAVDAVDMERGADHRRPADILDHGEAGGLPR